MFVKKPPMGWNSWNTFTHAINEELIMQTADIMANEGYLEAGYEYLVIDDCWSERERDKNGNLVADHEKFPHGMKYVADYVHSKGLKFGMYSCDGILTCAGYPGSFGHEFEDAKYFAEVGVDYLKYDNCYKVASVPNTTTYQKMALALKASGRDIVFSACNWGTEDVHTWARSRGTDLFRSTGDIFNHFESMQNIADSQKDKLAFAGPGCYNDVDMLVVGMKSKTDESGAGVQGDGMTEGEQRYHFAWWCMVGSPLMMGCDLRDVSDEAKKLMLNKNLIRINQDIECRPPYMAGHKNAWFRNLSNNEYALGFFNDAEDGGWPPVSYLSFNEIGLTPNCGYGLELTDAFTGEKVGVFEHDFKVKVPGHDCAMYLAKVVKLS